MKPHEIIMKLPLDSSWTAPKTILVIVKDERGFQPQ